jgi:hypothetical protein
MRKLKSWEDERDAHIQTLSQVWWVSSATESRLHSNNHFQLINENLQLQGKSIIVVLGKCDDETLITSDDGVAMKSLYSTFIGNEGLLKGIFFTGKLGRSPECWIGLPELDTYLQQISCVTDSQCKAELAALVNLIDVKLPIAVELKEELSETLDNLLNGLVSNFSGQQEVLSKKLSDHVGDYVDLNGLTLNYLFNYSNDGAMRTRSEVFFPRTNLKTRDLDFYGELGRVVYDNIYKKIWCKFIRSCNEEGKQFNPKWRNIEIKLKSWESIVRKCVTIRGPGCDRIRSQLKAIDCRELTRMILNALLLAAQKAINTSVAALPFKVESRKGDYLSSLKKKLELLKKRNNYPQRVPRPKEDQLWEKKVDEKLQAEGLKRLSIKGDGNCALNALCHGRGIEVDCAILRQILLDFLIASGWNLEAQAIGKLLNPNYPD